MHIPDGLMAPLVAVIGFAEFLPGLALAIHFSSRELKGRQLSRLAVLSAGIFVAQMINFPIGAGTTGHLIGGALMAIVAGPSLAIIGMTIVLLIQALMFGDGGLTAFGLNALNMALIAPLTGWGIYSLLSTHQADRRSRVAVAAGAWGSVFLSASACASELAVSSAISSGSYGISGPIAIPALLGYYAVIGIGEAAITVGILSYLDAVAPDSLRFEKVAPSGGDRESTVRWRTMTAVLAVLVVFAATLPFYFLYSDQGKDALERTMDTAGAQGGNPVVSNPFGYGESYFAYLFAGILGFTAVAAATSCVLRIVRAGGAKGGR